ncbi:YgfZ/GcvT domain-containing protein [Polynucleobacter asymbioticus]|uniref:Glycine cleavage T protein (Aminomethyl transferase) n=1 Tax=Polynucleobacter asymbioticus (strain DSM 18221 / CIP 109841 / QLW-P1DMWA-1) TaxID=312153 RepID=A4SXH0_POLAQ|nr:folate-binding protein YgfZ [Polynucleobacter asymbioticus]ABP34184.1 glycine cleavage T protein (aminomethyl transferase) [Polynucleobacter asymbioticus QLW-P1DMWA-1]APC06022.1 glycine cleavage system protein T [Polynucleobacter asymbioticus]
MNQITQNASIKSQPPISGGCLLPQWGMIFVEGPDATSFLQSQLSNSLLGMKRTHDPDIAKSSDSVRLVGYCSPKGRLISSAWIGLFPTSESSDDRYVLFISKDIAATTAKRLAMYVLRSKVKVIDMSSEWNVSGFFDAAIHDGCEHLKTSQDCLVAEIPNVLVQGLTYTRYLIAKLGNEKTEPPFEGGIDAWNDLEVLSAIPRIVLATQEQFVPQMINFESVAGVDFKKGCYPGQEIVARSQYRGAIKRRLFLANITNASIKDALTSPGTELFHSDDSNQPAGMVVLSAPSMFESGRIDLQVECKLEALESGSIHLGAPDGPMLKIDSLPYPLLEI